MTIIELWLLGIALAMDCFTVSLASGISARKFISPAMPIMAICFGLFQGGMTFIGFLGTNYFSEYLQSVDHWIAFGLLAYLGGRMIWEGCQNEDESKSMNLLDTKTIITMSVATSIDALAVGISFACLNGVYDHVSILLPVSIIALCSLIATFLGQGIGIQLGKKINLPVGIVGGIILILIGIKVLFEHLS